MSSFLRRSGLTPSPFFWIAMASASEALRAAIQDSMAIKPKGHEFALASQPVILRHMSVTGG